MDNILNALIMVHALRI